MKPGLLYDMFSNKAFITLYLPLFLVFEFNSWVEVLIAFPFCLFLYFLALRTQIQINRKGWAFTIDIKLEL